MAIHVERKIIPVPFEIYEDQLKSCLGYIAFITKHTEANRRIPVSVMKKFLSHFKLAGGKETQLTRIKAGELSNSTYAFFKDSTYDFSIRVRKLPRAWVGKRPKRENVNYSLEGLLNTVATNLYEQKSNRLFKTRDECFRFLYSTIHAYLKNDLEDKIKFTEYKIIVLAAHMVEKLNMPFTGKKNPTNHDLFQSARHKILS